jgi:hypothetical protein
MAAAIIPIIAAAPQIVQGVASLVHSIEHLFGKGNGESKKAATQAALSAAISTYNAAVPVVPGVKLPTLDSEAQTAFGNLVDSIVAVYNVIGVFQKK